MATATKKRAPTKKRAAIKKSAPRGRARHLNPLGDRVVVKPREEFEARTASGLVIPDTAKEKPQLGEVIAVGPGEFQDGERIPMDIKAGDTVVYSKYGGTEVKYEGEEFLILSARDVLAVIR
ncbi:MAG TPA: co-chaperone GroES [Acidimicrobiia bacterium]|nr:co-chaperone GroES [Acidimicrobiia bacterium]